jgi:hypothetical protein
MTIETIGNLRDSTDAFGVAELPEIEFMVLPLARPSFRRWSSTKPVPLACGFPPRKFLS